MRRLLVPLLACGACSLSAPALNYQGLPCVQDADCGGGGLFCVTGSCGPRPTGSTGGARHGNTGTTGSGSSGGSTAGGTGTAGSSGGNGGVVVTALPQAGSLAAGYAYTCSVDGSGAVWCWGNGLWAQLGNGGAGSSWIPQAVQGLPSGAASITAENGHTCAILFDGQLWCWGGDGNGELGNGTQALFFSTAQQVTGLSGVTAVAAGVAQTCAIADGVPYCWGYGGADDLGVGNNTDTSFPEAVLGFSAGSGALTLAGGDFHFCLLQASGGKVFCWGSNSAGQLGSGGNTPSNTPVPVQGLPPAVALTAGHAHTCAIALGGAVYCWGLNDVGELGSDAQPQPAQSTQPLPVAGLPGAAVAIAAQLDHTCALTDGDQVFCWGDNAYGELGAGATGPSSATPVQIQGLPSHLVAIAAGEYHSCAMADGGAIACWGYGGYGQLGNAAVQNSALPVLVQFDGGESPLDAGNPDGGPGPDGGPTVVSLQAGFDETLVVRSDGHLVVWGNNLWGQLGDGTIQTRVAPGAPVNAGGAVIGACAGEEHTCAVLAGGAVECWGDGAQGQLGNGTTQGSGTPLPVALPGPATLVACGGAHSCAAMADGGAYCWGDNTAGSLGDGTLNSSPKPVAVKRLGLVKQLANADNVTCALLASGAVECWGGPQDVAGQQYSILGEAQTAQSDVPVAVSGFDAGIVQIALATAFNGGGEQGFGHACAVGNDGSLSCWGSGNFGELGNGQSGTGTYSPVPLPVAGLPPVVQVATGSNHTCALTAGGAVYCWGWGVWGALGNGSTQMQTTPTPVSGLSGGVTALAAGEFHTCALSGQALSCWGFDGDGELGSGNLYDSRVPAPVLLPSR